MRESDPIVIVIFLVLVALAIANKVGIIQTIYIVVMGPILLLAYIGIVIPLWMLSNMFGREKMPFPTPWNRD